MSVPRSVFLIPVLAALCLSGVANGAEVNGRTLAHVFKRARVASEDTIYFRNNDVLRGRVVNESFRIVTPYGAVDVATTQCAGLSLSGDEQFVDRLITVRRNQLTGALIEEKVRFVTGTANHEITIPRAKIRQIVFRKREEEAAHLDAPGRFDLLVMRNGDLVTGCVAGKAFTLKTEYGELALAFDEVDSLETPTRGSETFVKKRNGDVVRGELEKTSVAIDVGFALATGEAPFKQIAKLYIGDARQRVATYGENYVVDLGSGVKTEMIWIPGGRFDMGASRTAAQTAATYGGEESFFHHEHPSHEVALDEFWLGRTEVTVAQFRQFVEATNYRTTAERQGHGSVLVKGEWEKRHGFSWRNPGFAQNHRHPVVGVSRDDAEAFCGWLSDLTGYRHSLPTEAQWEYACRAGTRTEWSWGDTPVAGPRCMNGADDSEKKARANAQRNIFSWRDGNHYTSLAGSYLSNRLGLYDMHGNVWEWCRDWYGDDYYERSTACNPPGPWTGKYGVLRGGSWMNVPSFSRSAYRTWDSHVKAAPYYGFRVCRSVTTVVKGDDED